MITDGTLHARIIKLRSDLTDNDFLDSGTIHLQDDSDGKGAYIKNWTHPTITRPTDNEIKEVTL
tara:strand:- start:44 stop:235 length:192 start_codon:yes stop_codon:yes gene_type:complete